MERKTRGICGGQVVWLFCVRRKEGRLDGRAWRIDIHVLGWLHDICSE